MHLLITGHTGFKGSWLAVLLQSMGHKVSGFSLKTEESSLFERAGLQNLFEHDGRGDIRDRTLFADFVKQTSPDVAIHMAAQALVRESYRDPSYTFTTNVDGTLSFLEGTEKPGSIGARLVITSDKVYRNDGREIGYVEEDPLGGRDPYSASKSMADLLTQSWQLVHGQTPTGIVRAGNVIGGGDRAKNRLVPDLVHAVKTKAPINLRYPQATRPWQHVLDCLSGYLAALNSIISSGEDGVWNIGPRDETVASVKAFSEEFSRSIGAGRLFTTEAEDAEHEEERLHLNSRKIRKSLGWSDSFSFEESVSWTAQWERKVLDGASPREVTEAQVESFLGLASQPLGL